MKNFIQMTETLKTVVKEYLRVRFSIPATVFEQQPLDMIIAKLYQGAPLGATEETTASSPTQNNILWDVGATVTTSAVSLWNAVDYSVRAVTHNDGMHRLPTLKWLLKMHTRFEAFSDRYSRATTATALETLKNQMLKECREFFQTIETLLRTKADKASAFTVYIDGWRFQIYGVKDNKSELGSLIKTHLAVALKPQLLLNPLLREFNERVKTRESGPQTDVQLLQQNEKLRKQLLDAQTTLRQLEITVNESQTRGQHYSEALRAKELQHASAEQQIAQLLQERQRLQATEAELKQTAASAQQSAEESKRQHKALEETQQALTQNKAAEARISHTEQQALEDIKALRIQIATEKQEHDALKQDLAIAQEAQKQAHAVTEALRLEILAAREQQALLQQQLEERANSNAISQELSFEAVEDDLVLVDQGPLLLPARVLATLIPTPNNPALILKEAPTETGGGCTAAQMHVQKGEVEALQRLLDKTPESVNAISTTQPKKKTGGLFEHKHLYLKTLLELALFHMNPRISLDTRIQILTIILAKSPILSTTLCTLLINRLTGRGGEDKVDCPLELQQRFCDYALLTQTCSVAARSDLQQWMEQLEANAVTLQNSPLKHLLQTLAKPLTFCRLIQKAIILGEFQQLQQALVEFPHMDNLACYEMLYTPTERKHADGETLNLKTELLLLLEKSVAEVKVQEESLPSKAYQSLLTHMRDVIERFGAVLLSQGLTPPQRQEISRQIEMARAVIGLEKGERPAQLRDAFTIK